MLRNSLLHYFRLDSQLHTIDQLADTIYFDEAHVSAEGNRLVAERIYSTLQVHP